MKSIRQTMKLRLLAMGGIISVLSLVLMATRGVQLAFGGLLGVGIVILFAGLLWKWPASGSNRRLNSHP